MLLLPLTAIIKSVWPDSKEQGKCLVWWRERNEGERGRERRRWERGEKRKAGHPKTYSKHHMLPLSE